MFEFLGITWNIYGVVMMVMVAWFLIMLWRVEKTHDLDWVDMITRDGRKISTTKVLQLVGGVVGTFIIIKVTLQGDLTWDLFAIYLAYVASIDGFSKFMIAKYGADQGSGGYGGGYGGRPPKRRRDSFDDDYEYEQYGYQRSPKKDKKTDNTEELAEAEQENIYRGGRRTDMID